MLRTMHTRKFLVFPILSRRTNPKELNRKSTKEVLQDTARNQYELNKRARRHVFAQAAARGNEWGAAASQLPPPPPRMYADTGSRMRSGSGTSRTTTTSDSGEFFEPVPHHSRSHPTLNASLSPTRIPANLPPMAYSPAQPSGSSTSSFPALSPGGASSIASNPASVLSPIATRMRERDADAMEKYKLRQRSGSATTASTTESPSQNGNVLSGSPSMVPPVEDDDLSALHPLVTVGSVAPRRRLRPSASATQLRTHSHNELASSITPNSTDPSRNRSGTSPAMLKQASSPARHTPSHSETLPLTPTQNSVRPQGIRGGGVWELDKETYIGPPSEYARFPPPPVPPKEPPEKQTTTPTTTTPTSHSRRLPFGILSHKHSDHNTNPNHKRNISMSSIGAKV